LAVSISVVTPVYNTGSLLLEIHSCLNQQTKVNFEWLIINDGSTDDETLSILDQVGNDSVNYTIIHTSNHGAPAARNKGIEHAKGKYIKFIDADDLIPENHLESQISVLDRHASPSTIVVSPFKILRHYNGNREIIYSRELDKQFFEKPLMNSLDEFCFHHSGCLYHTEFVKGNLHWDESLHAHQDLDFLWQAMLAGATFQIDNSTYFINREHNFTERITTQKSPVKWESRFEAVKKVFLKLKGGNYGRKYFQNIQRRFDKLIVGAYLEFPETGAALLASKKQLTGKGLSFYLCFVYLKKMIKRFITD